MNDTTRNWIIIGVIVVLVLAVAALAGGIMGGHMFTAEATGNRPWMWGLGMGVAGLLMLIFWAVVIAGIVLLVRQLVHSGSVSPGATPIDVLKRRYAAGEITREQYEQMKRDLET